MEEALGDQEKAPEDAAHAPEKRREGSAASRSSKNASGKGGAIGAPIGARSMGKLAKSSKGNSPSHYDKGKGKDKGAKGKDKGKDKGFGSKDGKDSKGKMSKGSGKSAPYDAFGG